MSHRTISEAEIDGRIIRYNPAWLRRCGWEYHAGPGYWLKRGVAARSWLLAMLLEEQDQRNQTCTCTGLAGDRCPVHARYQGPDELEAPPMKLGPDIPPRVNMVIWRRQSWQAVPRREEIWQADCGPYSAEGRTAGEAADRLMPTVLAWMERELTEARLRPGRSAVSVQGAHATGGNQREEPRCPKCQERLYEDDHGRGRMTLHDSRMRL